MQIYRHTAQAGIQKFMDIGHSADCPLFSFRAHNMERCTHRDIGAFT
jgi:hypothetical protein